MPAGLFARVGNGEADETDGMLGVVHLLQQLLGQGKNDIERGQLTGLGQAAGDLAEIMELDFQGQRISPEIFLFETADQLNGNMIQLDDDRRTERNVFLQRTFAADGLADAHRLDGAQVYAPGKIVVDGAYLAKLAEKTVG